jgi:lipopolysaccharide/colanic/teichoic acid biosynthesis glycosyltransferase
MSDTTTVPISPPLPTTLPRLTPAWNEGEDRRAAAWYCAARACMEWPVALVLFLVALPVLIALALLLKVTSPGPIAYSQVRLGRHGKPFRIIKLRTMADGCEASTGPVWSIVGDPRVTTVGRWLRDTHLDELPQLWNVLRGDMSLIGPRPERPEIAEQIERWLPEFRQRLAVRPGIAGLAQVCLPPDADLFTVRRKLAYDLRYIQSIGPWLDLRIAAATVLHCAGLAASAASNWLVQPSTPVPLIEPKSAAPALGFSLAEHGSGRADNDRDDVSKVA